MRIMAIDLGLARTGVAISDPLEQLASPVCTIEQYYQPERMAKRVAEEAGRAKAERIIVGHPRNMDGSEGFRALAVRAFADLLRAETTIPLDFADERLSTVEAHGFLDHTGTRGKKRKQVIDTLSAEIILQDYLDKARRSSGT